MSLEKAQGCGSPWTWSPGFRASVQLGLGHRKELRSGVQQIQLQGPPPPYICKSCSSFHFPLL